MMAGGIPAESYRLSSGWSWISAIKNRVGKNSLPERGIVMSRKPAPLFKQEIEQELFSEGFTPEKVTTLWEKIESAIYESYQAGYNFAESITGQPWSNNTCLGYVILGAKRVGYTEEEIQRIVRATNGQFDGVTLDEAKRVYNSSSY